MIGLSGFLLGLQPYGEPHDCVDLSSFFDRFLGSFEAVNAVHFAKDIALATVRVEVFGSKGVNVIL